MKKIQDQSIATLADVIANRMGRCLKTKGPKRIDLVAIEYPVYTGNPLVFGEQWELIGMIEGKLGKTWQNRIVKISPTQVKFALTGNGRATKDDMVEEAKKQFPEWWYTAPADKLQWEAIADAIGVAKAALILSAGGSKEVEGEVH